MGSVLEGWEVGEGGWVVGVEGWEVMVEGWDRGMESVGRVGVEG